MANITVVDKITGDTLTAAEFQQLLDALKSGTLSINTESVSIGSGVFTYANGRMFLKNKATSRAIDRTSDVVLETVTVANTTAETILYTFPMAANAMEAGNVLKLNAGGVVSNDGGAFINELVIRYKIGGVLIATLETDTAALADSHWSLNSHAVQRTIGVGGKRARDMVLQVGNPVDGGDQVFVNNISDIDTTANMDIVITVQWASAKLGNTISLLQGSLEYKN